MKLNEGQTVTHPKFLSRQKDHLKNSLIETEDSSRAYLGRNSSLPGLVAQIPQALIIDYGGGSGWLEQLVRTSVVGISSERFRYMCVESEDWIAAWCSHSSHIVRPDQAKEMIKAAGTNFSRVLYMNSVIEYMEDDEIWRIVVQFDPHFIVLDAVLWNAKMDFYTIQKYYSVEKTIKIRRLNGLITLMNNRNYDLVLQVPYFAEIQGALRSAPPMENFALEARCGQMLSLWFRQTAMI